MKTKRVKYFLKSQVLRIFAKLFPVKVVRNQRDRKEFTKIWYTIWLEEKYAQPNEPIIKKYSRYDKFSVDLLIKFLGILPVGTFRFIHNNKKIGLPVLNAFEIEKRWLNDDKIIEATLLTVKKRFRRLFFHLPSLILLRELARYCKKNNLEGPVMACDRRLFFLMRCKLGFPIHQIGLEKFYEGSITYPSFINTEEFYQKMGNVNPFFTS